MKLTLKIDIDCGEVNCAKEPGRYCKYFGYLNGEGRTAICRLFPDKDESYTLLRVGEDGWTRRCEKCVGVAFVPAGSLDIQNVNKEGW